MKKIVQLFFLVFMGNLVMAQFGPTTPWVWMRGNAGAAEYGIYGTLGVSDAANTPGSRNGAATWTDAAGKLWLFGGTGRSQVSQGSGTLNDLWRYDPVTNEWTWMSGTNQKNKTGVYGTMGTPAPGNYPGGRMYSTSWIDAAGNLWLFGGEGFATDGAPQFTDLNDLWKYDPVVNQWTWVNGDNIVDQTSVYPASPGPTFNATNKPGARHAPVSWLDAAGNVWLFGGHDVDAIGTTGTRFYNDLWKYDPVINQWAWIGGDNVLDQEAIYGTQGIAAPTNKPGSREEMASWMDAAGNLWLFGGIGRDAAGGSAYGYLNDVWKYDPVTNEWTWMGGNPQVDQFGVYGTQGTPGPTNVPGGRRAPAIWKDAGSEAIGIFGGLGQAESGGGYLNDLWRYNPTSNEWTWMKGDKTANVTGVYTDPQGVPGLVNKPGARRFTSTWVDNAGEFWLFGGLNNSNGMNDLWRINSLVLPVKYESFTAEKVNGTALLKWVTSQELNASRFEIQHSSDGTVYTTIGTLTAAGTTSERTSYSFVHTNPAGGANFYRLKQVDLDEKFEFSEVRKLNFESGGPLSLTVTGNPFDATLQYRVSSPVNERAVLRFTDISGRTLWTKHIELQKGSTASFSEPASRFPSGVYVLSLTSSLGTKQVKVIKR